MRAAQAKVREFCESNGLRAAAEARLLDLVSETGELSKEILKATEYGKRPFSKTPGFEEELGDLLFSAIALANGTGVDLETALEQALGKYRARLAKKGTASSEE